MKGLKDIQKKINLTLASAYLSLGGFPENNYVAEFKEMKRLEKEQFDKDINELTNESIKQIVQNIYENNNHFNMASNTSLKMYNNFAARLETNLSELYAALEQNPVSLTDSLVNTVLEAQKNANVYVFNVETKRGSMFALDYDLSNILNSNPVFTEQRGSRSGLNALKFPNEEERQEQNRRYRYPSGPDSSSCA